jgi:predicted TPR repeat methyltransferase
MIRKIIYHLTHNVVVNKLIILFRAENKVKSINRVWTAFKYNPDRSLQENVGFSHRDDVAKAIDVIHADLRKLVNENKHVKSVLDVGCGTGLYLKDFENSNLRLTGIDLSSELLNAAATHVPEAKFICGSYLQTPLPEKMDLIYSISVLEYISRNDLRRFFRKLYDDLNHGGLVFIQYPHALSLWDTFYPELNYIKYSPQVVERVAEEYFTIERHSHGFNKKTVGRYDKEPFMVKGGSFVNGYVLIGRKKT